MYNRIKMNVAQIELSEEDIAGIKDAVTNRKPIDFYCNILTPEQKNRFQKILSTFLNECDQSYLYNYLSYCLLELLDNASKANAKRIYFQENHLDINNEKDYTDGMKAFKEKLSDNNYINTLETGMLQVHLQLSANDVISLTVSNNTKITNSEYERIKEKLEKTKGYKDMADAFEDIDQTEGSGFGLISVVIMLKKLGLDTGNLKFQTTEEETVATIEVPKDSLVEL